MNFYEILLNFLVNRIKSSAKIPRADLILNFESNQVEYIDNGKGLEHSPREFKKLQLDPLLKMCSDKISVIVVNKSKDGLIKCYPQ